MRCHSDWKLLCISSSGSKEKGIWTSNVEMLSFQDFYLEILSIPTFQWVEGNDKAVNHHCNSENSKIPTVPQDSRSKSFSFPVRNSQRFLKYKAAKCFPPPLSSFHQNDSPPAHSDHDRKPSEERLMCIIRLKSRRRGMNPTADTLKFLSSTGIC